MKINRLKQLLDNLMSPEGVTRQALETLGKQPLLVPGKTNNFLFDVLKSKPLDEAIAASAEGTAKFIEEARPGTIPNYSKRYVR